MKEGFRIRSFFITYSSALSYDFDMKVLYRFMRYYGMLGKEDYRVLKTQ